MGWCAVSAGCLNQTTATTSDVSPRKGRGVLRTWHSPANVEKYNLAKWLARQTETQPNSSAFVSLRTHATGGQNEGTGDFTRDCV